MKYTLTIPKYRPPLANEWKGFHWSRAYRMRRACSDLLAAYARLASIPKAAVKRRVTLTVRLEPRQKRPDADAFDKLVLDALVAAGLLADDDADGLEGRMEVVFERGTKDNWGTIFTLEDV